MADPIILLYYESSGSMNFGSLHELLSGCGLGLHHPETGLVTRRSEVGEQVLSSLQEIVALGKRGKFVAADFWVDAAVAAHVSMSFLGAGSIFESISMDTLNDTSRIAISKEMIARFRGMGERRMLVADLVGDSVQYIDWSAFFCEKELSLAEALPTQVAPTVLGIESERFDTFAERFRAYEVEHFDRMVLASRPARIEDFPAWRWEQYKRLGQWTAVPSTTHRGYR